MKTKKFRFLEWQVYIDAKKLLSIILTLVRKLPKEYRFELGSQGVRSAFSVVLNIAEGSAKISDKELNKYFEIALGSLYETLSVVDVFRSNKLVTDDEFDDVFNLVSGVANQLGGFKKKLVN